ncbi:MULTISPECIES: PaaI family thioesterase [Sutcliffiella]|uniref:PaaI family thioesterase n=1 Tax=Sutcliffiella TaxID=2837511 RepID=UPI00082D6BC4|nr:MULTISPECIES: PaaI family thioesterase [Sutcliffiella]MED4015463.1 PaaI family thioesterase [Sutcliffiella cohnii]WBL13407.1 PaaI family thioesterase [Sutcliffiella sp. NC1]
MDLREDWGNYLKEATDEELAEAALLLHSFKRKRNGDYSTFVGALFGMERDFDEENGTLTLTVQNSTLLNNSIGILHGGLTATILDSTMGTLANNSLPDDKAVVTTEMKVNFLKPGIGDAFRCVANIIHKGSKIIVVEGKVFSENHKLIAHSTGSFFIINRKR